MAAFFETAEPGPIDTRLKQLVDTYQPKTIGLTIGGTRGVTRSLTYDTHALIVEAIGPAYAARIVSAQDLIEEYADSRLPAGAAPSDRAVTLTEALTRRALSQRGDRGRQHHRRRRAPLALRCAVGARRAHVVPARPARAATRRRRRHVAVRKRQCLMGVIL